MTSSNITEADVIEWMRSNAGALARLTEVPYATIQLMVHSDEGQSFSAHAGGKCELGKSVSEAIKKVLETP